MNKSYFLIALVFTCLMVFPMLSASCLTDTEINAIRNVANSTNVSADVFQNIFEHFCNEAYLNQTLSSFNASIQAQMTTLNNQVGATLNNSALVQSLNQVALIYNTSVVNMNDTANVGGLIASSEARQNSKIDNQTLSLITQFNDFKNSVNQQLIDKQTNNLTTNRIILIVLGVACLLGAIWYFSRRRQYATHTVAPLPYDMNNLRSYNDKNSSHPVQDKRKSAK